MRRFHWLLLGPLLGIGASIAQEPPATPSAGTRIVAPVPDALREALGLSPFYRKHCDAGGLPVISSEKVADYALLEAAYLIDEMLVRRPEVRAAMIANKVRCAIMAVTEFTTDIPEHSHMRPKEYADKRARGMGATRRHPCVSGAEENLLGYPGDPYAAENILIHEFAHAIHITGLASVDPTFDGRLEAAYEKAMKAGLWKGKYAATNAGEYWAEGVQSWFDTNRENDGSHNHVDTREELKEYDPELAKLVEEVHGDGPWRYTRPRDRREPGHLKGYDPARAPTFSWPAELLEWNRKHAAEVESRRRRESLRLVPLGNGPLPVSKEGGKATSILFVNRTEGEATIEVVGPDGSRRPSGKLAPGERAERETTAGQVWLVTGPGEGSVATVTAGETPGRAVIGARD